MNIDKTLRNGIILLVLSSFFGCLVWVATSIIALDRSVSVLEVQIKNLEGLLLRVERRVMSIDKIAGGTHAHKK